MSTVKLGTLKAVFVDGSTPKVTSPSAQPMSLPQFTAGYVEIECFRSNGAAKNIASITLIWAMRRRPTDPTPAISIQATPTNTAEGKARLYFVPGHWLGVDPKDYHHDLVAVVTEEDRFPVVLSSPFVVTAENVHPDDDIEEPPSMSPLGQGPPGLTKVAALAADYLALSGIPADQDGVALEAGDYILLTAQYDGIDNGPWVVSADDWTRPVEFPDGARAAATLIGVTGGTTHGGRVWQCTTKRPDDVVGIDELAFDELIGSGGGAVDGVTGEDGVSIDNTDPRNPVASLDLDSSGIQTAAALFNGAQSLDGEYPYVDITWPTAYDADADYRVTLGLQISSGGLLPVIGYAKTGGGTGVRVYASAQFTGTVNLTAIPLAGE